MTADKLIGPATLIYLASVSTAALWWASDLTTRVAQIESSTVTAERIARLETQVAALNENTNDLKRSVNNLVHELKRK
ncbi:MAG: hypothetical protein ACKVRO_08640 [Micropepsaceae bacterium]